MANSKPDNIDSPVTAHYCHGRWSRSTFPPLTMTPTRAPATWRVRSMRHARGTAADGSTTIFNRSNIILIARTIASSLQTPNAATYARIAANVRGASDVRRPSAIVTVGGNGSILPERKLAAASPAFAGSAPKTRTPGFVDVAAIAVPDNSPPPPQGATT